MTEGQTPATYNNLGKLFLLLTFVIGIPSWFIHIIDDKKLKWLIFDTCNSLRISLLPLLIYYITDNKLFRKLVLLYFYLTLTNVIPKILGFYGLDSGLTMQIRIGVATIIIIWFVWKKWEDE